MALHAALLLRVLRYHLFRFAFFYETLHCGSIGPSVGPWFEQENACAHNLNKMIQPHGKRYGTLVFFSSMKILEILLLIKDIPTNIHHNIEKSQVLDNLHDFADLNLRSKHKRGQIHGYPSRVRVGRDHIGGH